MELQLPNAQLRARPGRIVRWLLLAYFSVVTVLFLLGGLTYYGLTGSEIELTRAKQSMDQLENARTIEGAFNLYLLEEIRRRLSDDAQIAESAAAGNLRGALLQYRRKIGEEIAAGLSEGERGIERAEMVRSSALSDIFETIETESTLERATRSQSRAGDPNVFLTQIAQGRDKIFQAVVFEILQDERAEAAAAFGNLESLRQRLTTIGAILAIVFAVTLATFGLLFYRGLMRPIQRLTTAVEGFAGQGDRAPDDLPGEFAVLAQQFNHMADLVETDQQRLQAEVAARTSDLEQANASLTRIDQTRRSFFANISHELRTPVTILLGEAQIALRNPGDERGALDRIAANSGYLRRRSDDLLHLARSEDGALKLSMAPMDLTEAINTAVDHVRSFASTNGIALSLDTTPDAQIRGDAEAVRQAALALLDNAIKFSPPGSEILITTSPTGFCIQDQGPGFDDSDPKDLFDRYAQTGQGRAGLGLAIVKWIADQHDATLSAVEGTQGGAKITMDFPA